MERARKSYAAKLLLASLLAVGSGPAAVASANSAVVGGNSVAAITQQQASNTPKRLSPRLQRQLNQQPQALQRVLINCNDAQALATTITAAGYEATAMRVSTRPIRVAVSSSASSTRALNTSTWHSSTTPERAVCVPSGTGWRAKSP